MSILKPELKVKLSALLAKFNIKLADETPTKLEFKASAKLSDGSEIHTTGEGFEVGADVYMVSADGEQVALPDGEYSLEDGKKLTCTGGLITEVGQAESEVDMKTEIANLKKAMTEMQDLFATELATLQTANDKLAADKTELQSKLTKLSKAPAAGSNKKPADDSAPEIKVPSHIKDETQKKLYLQAAQLRAKREAAQSN